MALERLDKTVSVMLNITRSESKKLIKQNKICINGIAVNDCAAKFNTESDKLSVDGKELSYEKYVYYLLNKPKGVLSASRDKNAPTVLDLIEPKDRRAGLFCVGRLDKNTTGLLVITDDGDYGHKMMSPKREIEKTYFVTLDGNIEDDIITAFQNGIELFDKTVCKPAKLEKVSENTAYITISEGKYHQIKRMFGTVGLGVNELKRVKEGNIMLPDDLPEGKYIKFSPDKLTNSIQNGSI